MISSMVKFKTDTGTEVQITPQDVTRLICPDATQKEVALFLSYCAAHRLDPVGSKDAYLIKYGSAPASIVTNYQVFNRRARKCKDYAGIESGVVTITPDGTVQHKQGAAVYPAYDGQLVGGWARVYVTGWQAPAYCEVSMADYSRPDSKGRNGWARMPGVMIEKVAKAAAWRLAYPDEFGGMYTREEMDQAEPVEVQPVQADALQPIRDEFRSFRAKTGKDAAGAMAEVCEHAGVTDMHEIPAEQVPDVVAWMQQYGNDEEDILGEF